MGMQVQSGMNYQPAFGMAKVTMNKKQLIMLNDGALEAAERLKPMLAAKAKNLRFIIGRAIYEGKPTHFLEVAGKKIEKNPFMTTTEHCSATRLFTDFDLSKLTKDITHKATKYAYRSSIFSNAIEEIKLFVNAAKIGIRDAIGISESLPKRYKH